MSRTVLSIGFSLGLALLNGGGARRMLAQGRAGGAAEAKQNAPSAPAIQVYARETVVDVTVTDAKGEPVHGLKESDFTVKEDGKQQAIKSFNEFGDAPAPASPLPKLPPDIYTNIQPPPASSAVNILLLDGLDSAPVDASDPEQVAWAFTIQKRVKQEAEKYVTSMPVGTRVMVLGMSRGLRVLQGITSDSALLSAAIETMELNTDGRAYTVSQWCAQQEMRNRVTMEVLSQIAADVVAIKGKKNLIWFSTGFPTLTDQRVNNSAGNPPPPLDSPPPTKGMPAPPPMGNGCLPDYTQDLLKAYALLAAAQVAVFPVDALGLGSAIPNPIGPGPLLETDNLAYPEAVADEHLSFEEAAEATGGAAFYNSNDLAGLAGKAVEKGANYYTLSYVPPGKKYDYGHHSIKIAVDQPGLHLTYRQSYDAVDPATIKPATGLTIATSLQEVNDAAAHSDPQAMMRLAMVRSMPVSTQILFDVRVLPSTEPAKPTDPPVMGALDPALKDKPLVRYGFQYGFPARQLAFSDGADGKHDAELVFDVAAYDGQGKLATSLGQSIKVAMTDEQYQELMKGPFRFFQQLDLPTGALFLRIGILDRGSGKIGTLEIPLMVGKK